MNYPAHDPQLPVVAFDYDGVIADNTWPSPHLGKLCLKARDAMWHYFDLDCEVIVFTARPDEHLPLIRKWLDAHGLGGTVYEVTNRKPRASLYFDDRAVKWPL